jgi:hypothetical protein
MKNRLSFTHLALGAFLFAATFAPSASAKTHLKISANTIVVESFNKWNAETPWERVDHFAGPYANRPTVDLLLELQALRNGGLDFDFELVTTPNYERAKMEVIQGGAQLTAETIWDDEIADSGGALLKTDPVIRNGEFEKGIYVLPSNEKLLKISSLDELRECTGAVVSTWALDVKTFEGMKLKGLEKAGKPENVFLMIQKQRADFTLAEFSSLPDMSNENSGVKLVPVPKCKVAISGSRSWIVSKATPDSTAIHAALVKGTQALRTEGRIERAYHECGFLNARIADWKRLF